MPHATDGVQHYDLGCFRTQTGEEIPDAVLAFKTWGDSSLPAIVYPTWFSGDIEHDNGWLISTRHAGLNPDKYFIIVAALFGNGQSSSPSNSVLGKNFPATSVFDNVKAQHQLVTEHLKIKNLFAVLGWSMGAATTFQWSVSYPTMMEKCVPFCGAARTALHNITFLKSLVMTLELDPAFKGGDYAPNEQPLAGKAVFSTIYSSWGFSQAFYRERLYEALGWSTLQAFLDGFWVPLFRDKDALDLRHMLNTWISADITCTPDRSFTHNPTLGRSSDTDYANALASIKASVLVVPGRTDLYFPPEDSEFEVSQIPRGRLYVLESNWGHFAGGPGLNPVDVQDLDSAIGSFFAVATGDRKPAASKVAPH